MLLYSMGLNHSYHSLHRPILLLGTLSDHRTIPIFRISNPSSSFQAHIRSENGNRVNGPPPTPPPPIHHQPPTPHPSPSHLPHFPPPPRHPNRPTEPCPAKATKVSTRNRALSPAYKELHAGGERYSESPNLVPMKKHRPFYNH